MSTTKQGDRVFTPDWAVRDILNHFRPEGRCLEPFAGQGAFMAHAPGWNWCELDLGRDFFDHTGTYDWIVSNPPYSKLRKSAMHAFSLAENVVLLVPLRNYFSGYGFIRDARKYGDVKHIRLYGTGGNLGFPMGNAIGAIHWQRGYRGPTGWSDASQIQGVYPDSAAGRRLAAVWLARATEAGWRISH
jgi:hypothetical protein